MLKRIKRIWIVSLIIIIAISFGLSIYLYNTPDENEKILINWANERMKDITYKNTFKIQEAEINKEKGYCIISYHYDDEQGENQSCREVWKMEDNEIKTNLGDLGGTKVMDLPIGYLNYTSDKLKEIATEIENDSKTVSLDSNRLTRLLEK